MLAQQTQKMKKNAALDQLGALMKPKTEAPSTANKEIVNALQKFEP